jgi:acetyltransferase-like isoleucine patch superfamily enzyme
VTDSIVGRGARIAAGVRVDGAVVGQRAEVMRDLTPGDQVPTDGHT